MPELFSKIGIALVIVLAVAIDLVTLVVSPLCTPGRGREESRDRDGDADRRMSTAGHFEQGGRMAEVLSGLRAANAASRSRCKQPEDCVWPACGTPPQGDCGGPPAPDAMREALRKRISGYIDAIRLGATNEGVTNAIIRDIDSLSLQPVRGEWEVADQIIGDIEKRFPDWRSYRDLVDCIDVTLHALRRGG